LRRLNTTVSNVVYEMMWIAVVVLVCVAAMAVALIAGVAYLLYLLARHFVSSTTKRVMRGLSQLRGQDSESVGEPVEPVVRT
jgi:hypothetical protein